MLSKIIKYLALIATIATVTSTLYDATTILTKIGFMKKIINISDEMITYDKFVNIRPVFDIKVFKPEKVEKKDYKPAALGYFDGTVRFCVQDGKYAKDCFGDGVTVVEPKLPSKFTSWAGKQFVNLRYEANEFKYQPDGDCDKGFKRCNSEYCVVEYKACPVTKVFITDNAAEIERYKNVTTASVHHLKKEDHMIVLRENYTAEDKDTGIVNGLWTSLNYFPCLNHKLNGKLKSKTPMKLHSYKDSNTCGPEDQNLEAYNFVGKRKLLNFWKDNLGEEFIGQIPETERKLYQSEKINLYSRKIVQLKNSQECQNASGDFVKRFKHRIHEETASLRSFLYIRLAIVLYFGLTILIGFAPKSAVITGLTSLSFYYLYFRELSILNSFMSKFVATFGPTGCLAKSNKWTEKLVTGSESLISSLNGKKKLILIFVYIAAATFIFGLLHVVLYPSEEVKNPAKVTGGSSSKGVAEMSELAGKKKKVKRD